mmetsp:Transcript_113731/g.226356  ORF Transcript_113731/g.226356 Transcript_113731/m.226356 type:complete len:375 (-) Transcript_113731:379-1503(-)
MVPIRQRIGSCLLLRLHCFLRAFHPPFGVANEETFNHLFFVLARNVLPAAMRLQSLFDFEGGESQALVLCLREQACRSTCNIRTCCRSATPFFFFNVGPDPCGSDVDARSVDITTFIAFCPNFIRLGAGTHCDRAGKWGPPGLLTAVACCHDQRDSIDACVVQKLERRTKRIRVLQVQTEAEDGGGTGKVLLEQPIKGSMERRYLAHWSINHLDCMQSDLWRHTDILAANDACTESSMAVSIHSTICAPPALSHNTAFFIPLAFYALKDFKFGHGTSFEFLVRGADARVQNINLHALALLIAHGFKFPMQRAAFLIDQVKAPWQPCFFQTFRLFSSFRIHIQCPVCLHLWGTIPAMHCQLLPHTFTSAFHDEEA